MAFKLLMQVFAPATDVPVKPQRKPSLRSWRLEESHCFRFSQTLTIQKSPIAVFEILGIGQITSQYHTFGVMDWEIHGGTEFERARWITSRHLSMSYWKMSPTLEEEDWSTTSF